MAVLGNVLKGGIKFTNTLKNIRQPKPFKWQKKALTKLCHTARETQFGQKYHFEDILKATMLGEKRDFYELFKQNVPVYDYNKIYEQWWKRIRHGEVDVTWPGIIRNFALSSGTSEASSKAIPVSTDMIRAIQRTSINQIISLGNYKGLPSNIFEKGYLMLGGSTLLSEVGHHYEGDLSGITQKTLPAWFHRFYKPGKKIAQEKDWAKKLDEITEKAKDWDIGFLAGVPAWIQLLMEKIIERHGVKNIHEVWPNLTAFAWGGVSLDPYKKDFEKLLGRPIIYIETYLASEGFLAYQVRPEGGLQLVLNNGIFFEFVPFNDENFDEDGNMYDNPETLMVDEVEPGKDYALLISTCSGAWRYLIGDTIRFTNVQRAEIVITGRTKHFLSLCGEHLSVDNMNKAIDAAAEHFGISIREFSVIGIKHPPLFAHQWYIGTDKEVDDDELGRFIDARLHELNDDYAVERGHALKNIFCRTLPNKAFYEWMKMQGKEGGQNKFPRVLKGNNQLDWERFVKLNYPLQQLYDQE
ncbi:GH3 auxin-responsive promoter family protein [Marinilongibacter aquaticus]|uniref:GH3 auxin-responsive promoter family protein n=1 Tax=Marinilongibacter aquaticus TaxID=2975157 RepID=UPI0021BD5D0F|nr:GH3 auxin-responsive promoter family protein [Marinilongibacter aquaticus]UBM59682.1 GH3 auxin-responsive promoter family protein [Marinilongibacter aquaticus]